MVDGLSGFPEAINTACPQARVQLCIVHMVRNSLKFVPWKDYKAVTADLKQIYQSATEQEAALELEQFAQKWDDEIPANQPVMEGSLAPTLSRCLIILRISGGLFIPPMPLKSVNSVIRKAIKNRRLFPNDDSAMKVIYLAIQSASKKWTMPIRNWKAAMNRFIIEFEEQLVSLYLNNLRSG